MKFTGRLKTQFLYICNGHFLKYNSGREFFVGKVLSHNELIFYAEILVCFLLSNKTSYD